MTDVFGKFKQWIVEFTEIGLLLVAFGIVMQILFGQTVAFVTGDVVSNLISLIKALGDQGVVGLIAVGVILWLFTKRMHVA
jgi:hypothetical protein